MSMKRILLFSFVQICSSEIPGHVTPMKINLCDEYKFVKRFNESIEIFFPNFSIVFKEADVVTSDSRSNFMFEVNIIYSGEFFGSKFGRHCQLAFIFNTIPVLTDIVGNGSALRKPLHKLFRSIVLNAAH
ncbi:hypothetical protein AVEN_216822-1 [Araneus ventricosus]|uniref:Uncharacterized protein n=1 Tax=Araneus ventricosus TaxID=182803 RepID=A0A4Y2JJT7_ARAVE|nr:hypothetical protein AVEN_216822-1 [Araneus ventricosus]